MDAWRCCCCCYSSVTLCWRALLAVRNASRAPASSHRQQHKRLALSVVEQQQQQQKRHIASCNRCFSLFAAAAAQVSAFNAQSSQCPNLLIVNAVVVVVVRPIQVAFLEAASFSAKITPKQPRSNFVSSQKTADRCQLDELCVFAASTTTTTTTTTTNAAAAHVKLLITIRAAVGFSLWAPFVCSRLFC